LYIFIVFSNTLGCLALTSNSAKYIVRNDRRTEYILFGIILLYTGVIWIDI